VKNLAGKPWCGGGANELPAMKRFQGKEPRICRFLQHYGAGCKAGADFCKNDGNAGGLLKRVPATAAAAAC